MRSEQVGWGEDGELRLPVREGGWVLVPRALVDREPALWWCAEYADAQALTDIERERLAEIAGVDGRAGSSAALLVPVGEWSRRTPVRRPAPVARPGGMVEQGIGPGLPGEEPSRPARRAARVIGAARHGVRLAARVDLVEAIRRLVRLAYGLLNLVLLLAALGWARDAWGGPSGTQIANGVLIGLVALAIGAIGQRLAPADPAAPGRPGPADHLGFAAIGIVAVVIGAGLVMT